VERGMGGGKRNVLRALAPITSCSAPRPSQQRSSPVYPWP
jgi:hypothetical protein